jgi:hypothetical protein
MQVDLVAKYLHDCEGPNQWFGIKLSNRETLGNNVPVPVPEISSKIGKAIEELLKEAIGIPMEQKHSTNILIPT